MALRKITDQERATLKQKSAQSLPDVPSLHNWTPDQFKKALTKVLFDNRDSFFYFYNKMVEDANSSFVEKINENVFMFENTVFDLANDFAQACHNIGKVKVYLGQLRINNEVVDIIGLRNSDNSVTIMAGSGHIMKHNSDGTVETINMPDTNIQVLVSDTSKLKNVKIEGYLNALAGEVSVKTPIQENHAVPKKYVDDIKAQHELDVAQLEAKIPVVDTAVTENSTNAISSKAVDTYVKAKLSDERTQTVNAINSAKSELTTNINNKTSKATLSSTIGTASRTNTGLLSSQDYTTLMNIVNLLTTNDSSFVDTFNELIKVFETFPEGTDIYSILNSKASQEALNELSQKVDNLEFSGSESKYTNSNPTTIKVGGIEKGSTFENKTYSEMFNQLLYPYVEFSVSFTTTPNGGVYKKGTSVNVTSGAVNVTLGSDPISIIEVFNGNSSIYRKTENIQGGNNIFNMGIAVTSNQKFKCAVMDSLPTPLLAYSPDFFFVDFGDFCAIAGSATLTENLITSLRENIIRKQNVTATITMNQQKAVFAYPSSYESLSIILDENNFNVTDTFVEQEIVVNNVFYKVYVLAGSVSSTMKYTFKF